MNQFEADQMYYWANMLNEAMEDKAQLDERRMNGPAAAANGGTDEIAEFRQMLNDGIVEFEFRKADGTLRHAIGTTSEQVVPTAERRRLDPEYDTNMASYSRRSAFIIWFWDLEKNACRCFNTNRFERIIQSERTTRHIDDNVERIGNIFIHRDEDATEERPARLTQELVDRIHDDIGDELVAGNGDIGSTLVGGGFTNTDAFDEVRVDVGPQGEPILKIVIRKRGTDSDQPYPLRINDLRQAIYTRYGVDVRKVIVDGEFQF